MSVVSRGDLLSRHATSITAVFAIVAAVVVSLGAIDGRSLWIDELHTWNIAQRPSLTEWWTEFYTIGDADGQIPLYHLYMFLWTFAFGPSEWALRLANLPLYALGSWAVANAPFSLRMRLLWLAVLSMHSFVWFYLNEARPYSMLLAGAALLTVAFARIVSLKIVPDAPIGQRRLDGALSMFSVGSILMIGATILGALWVASSALAIVIAYRRSLGELAQQALRSWPVLGAAILINVLLVLLSIQSFATGDRPTQIFGFSLVAMGYGVLEVLGVAGWGPGRNELRQGLNGVSPVELISMTILGMICLFFIVSAVRQQGNRMASITVCAACAPMVVLVAAGYLMHWRVVGRHISPLLFPVTLAYAFEIDRLTRRLALNTIGAVALVFTLVASTILIRVSERHEKDDYAAAAAFALPLLDQGKHVWWVASPFGAAYYGLVDIESVRDRAAGTVVQQPGTLTFRFPPSKQGIASLPQPDVVLYSKPEIYDPGGGIGDYVKARNMRQAAHYSAFQIYVR